MAAPARSREIALGAGLSFALNWVWENAQAYLFVGYRGFEQHLWACTVASVGDVAFVALVFAAVGAAWRDPGWHRRATAAHYLVAAAAGIAIAVAIELRALSTGRWAYDGMPLIPLTGIGLLPVVQMALLPVLVFALVRRAGGR